MKLLLAIGSVLLSAQVYAGSLTIQELGTTTETGDYPVCSNGAGKLLPCYDPNPIQPPDDPYTGTWTGTMTYDRNSTDTCYDADISMSVNGTTASSMVVRVTGAKPDVLPTRFSIPGNGFVHFISSTYSYDNCTQDSNTFCPFGSKSDFILQFNLNGAASGDWLEWGSDGCYGTWTFTKD